MKTQLSSLKLIITTTAGESKAIEGSIYEIFSSLIAIWAVSKGLVVKKRIPPKAVEQLLQSIQEKIIQGG